MGGVLRREEPRFSDRAQRRPAALQSPEQTLVQPGL